ncbi:MAG: archease [Thermodesulfobacteriota bacterium]
MKPCYETFEHGADVGIRGKGRTLEEAFANGAKALFALMADLSTVEPRKEIRVECSAPDIETLFMVWLNQLIALADIEKMVLCEFSVTIKDKNLTATARGESISPRKHDLGVEVKGATFTMLRVFQEAGYFVAQCVVDV